MLGWLASRFDLRQLRAENRRAPKAYFKGLNFLLNEQQDQAIDAFIEAVQSDPTPRNCTLPWATCFAAGASTTGRCASTSTCSSRGDLSGKTGIVPNMPWHWTF